MEMEIQSLVIPSDLVGSFHVAVNCIDGKTKFQVLQGHATPS